MRSTTLLSVIPLLITVKAAPSLFARQVNCPDTSGVSSCVYSCLAVSVAGNCAGLVCNQDCICKQSIVDKTTECVRKCPEADWAAVDNLRASYCAGYSEGGSQTTTTTPPPTETTPTPTETTPTPTETTETTPTPTPTETTETTPTPSPTPTETSATSQTTTPPPASSAAPISSSAPPTSSSVPAAGVPIHPNGNAAKCLDVKDANYANGAYVQIYDCNGTGAQKWVLNRGSTKVRLAGTNFCLDAGTSPTSGSKMKIWDCYDGLPAQQWWYTDDNRIALEGQGLCLDLTDGVLWNRKRTQVWQCTDYNNNQVWTQ